MDVLVVDSGELGELLATLVGRYGLTAAHVRSGEQALEMALAQPPKVVVIDAELPDANGLDVAELLRAELSARVVLTYPPSFPGSSETGVQLRIDALDGGFVRPFRSLALIDAVSRLAGRPIPHPGTAPLSSSEGAQVGLVEPFELDELEVDVVDAAPPATDIIDLEGEVTDPDAQPFVVEPAPPLREVIASDDRAAAFSPGALAELWRAVKARRNTPTPPPTDSEGNLSPRILGDLLDAFHQSQTTGELWIERGPARRVLLLRRGVVVGARSNIAGEDLLSIMKKRRALDDEAAARVIEAITAGEHRTVAEASLFLGFVPERSLRALAEEHVRRVAIGAFAWQTGRYRFTLEGRASHEPFPVQVQVGDIVVHAIVLTESDEGLRAAAPDDARFSPVSNSPYGLEHLGLSAQEARIVVAMDGTKTMRDLLMVFEPVPERTVRGLAAGLLCLDLVRYAGRGPASARKISFF